MSDITVTNLGTDLAIPGDDPFSAYGAKVGVQGLFLTFKNGEFLAGQDARVIPLGTRMAANMEGLRVGWRRWWDEQVTDDLTQLLTEQRVLQTRSSLGDNDPERWAKDNAGKPRDPWQLTNILELVDQQGERYIYSTGSRGGINAIGRLCKEYGKLHRQRPGQVPIITLGNDSYMHREFGKTYVPDFKIVSWANETALAAEAGAFDEIPFPPDVEPTPQPPAAAKPVGKTRF